MSAPKQEEESPQPLPQDQEANTVQSIIVLNISKEGVSSAFPVLKCKVRESEEEIEYSKAIVLFT